MKKNFIAAAAVIMFCAINVFAHPYESFNIVMSRYPKQYGGTPSDSEAKSTLEQFAKDVGQAIGGGSYGNSSGLNTFGFNMSIKMSYQQVTSEDAIVNKNGDTAIYYPVIQGEFGLTEKMLGVGRLSYSNDSYIIGGGVKYLLYEGYDYVPTVTLQSIYNYVIADVDDPYKGATLERRVKFNGWNLKNAATAYFTEVPYIRPYIFLSYDVTGLHAITSQRAGSSALVSGLGYGAGGSIALDPINLSFTISMYDGSPNYNFGIFFGF